MTDAGHGGCLIKMEVESLNLPIESYWNDKSGSECRTDEKTIEAIKKKRKERKKF